MHWRAENTGLVSLEASLGPKIGQIGAKVTTFLDFS